MTFYVNATYTPSASAAVDKQTAERVAREEEEGYRRALAGAWGPDDKLKAQTLDLHGIVEMRGYRRGGWQIHDLITDARFVVTDAQTEIVRHLKRDTTAQIVVRDERNAYLSFAGLALRLIELKDVRELQRNYRLRVVGEEGREARLRLWPSWNEDVLTCRHCQQRLVVPRVRLEARQRVLNLTGWTVATGDTDAATCRICVRERLRAAGVV